jgi:acyl-coenzyme A synthetase/AMP-(fatty) acid ligase
MRALAFQPDAADYYANGYWREGDMWGDFEAVVAARPGKVALRVGELSISYSELARAATALSARLAASGVDRGDVVILLGRNSIAAAVSLLACFHRGAVAAPLPPMFGSAQLSALVAQTGAKALIGLGGEAEIAKCEQAAAEVPCLIALRDELVGELAAAGDQAAPREAVDPDALAAVLHSSGTTSVPKGIMHSTNTLRYATEQLLARWELTSDDTLLVVAEFGFVGSLVFGYLPTLLSGGTGVLLQRWDAEEALRLTEQHRCTYTMLMPTNGADVIAAARETERDLSSLRVLCAAGLTRERRAEVYEVVGLPPLADYGLSEVPGHVCHGLHDTRDKILTTEGRPFEGTRLRVLRPDGEDAAPNELGAIVVNGPSRFLGFLGNDQLTRESLADWGGYITGDVGYLDDDGQLVYVGRNKDIIRRGGVTIVPAEIEPVLVRHAAIREAAVVPLPDERLGERACAALILEPGSLAPTLPDLQEFLAGEGLAKYMWPESIEVFDDFPRTSSLKPVKRGIVDLILERSAVGASRA